MSERRSGWLSATLTVAVAVAASAAAVAINAATDVTGDWPLGLDAIRDHPFAWAGALTGLVAVLALANWWAQGAVGAEPSAQAPGVPPAPAPTPTPTPAPATHAPPGVRQSPWMVDRPDEVEQVVSALTRAGSGSGSTVGITTALQGAGGFGKTTLATMACADTRIKQHFGGRIYPVTIGRDVRGAAAVVAKVNDLISRISHEQATFTDPDQAGQWLGELLDRGPALLLVLDDVWHQEQLTPFLAGDGGCSRLVTTRNPGLLDDEGVLVAVDQMSDPQATAVLTWRLPPISAPAVRALLSETGRWPLLLRLCNKVIAAAVRTGEDVTVAAEQLGHRLRTDGLLTVDDLTGEAERALDVADPRQRRRAVRATLAASRDLLSPSDRARFGELAVFAEDEAVPVALIAGLWRATAGHDTLQARQSCARLADLALVSVDAEDGGSLRLHDVLRDVLRQEAGDSLTDLNGVLIDAIAAGLPVPAGAAADGIAWWQLDHDTDYAWNHLVGHLLAADRLSQAEDLACDLRWVGARIRRSGVASAHADLALIGTERAANLAAALARMSHLLAPTAPEPAVIDILHSRVAVPEWQAQVAALRAGPGTGHPRLLARWAPADLPDPALRRALTGHDWNISSLLVGPDGRWLAIRDENLVVRLWDSASWELLASLKGVAGQKISVCAPDGSWLVVGGPDRSVQIWDVTEGAVTATLAGLNDWLCDMAVAPDGTWLAVTTDRDSSVGIWDAATGHQIRRLKGHAGPALRIAIAPDGGWLAVANARGRFDSEVEIRVWDTASWSQIAVLEVDRHGASSIAVAPDGSWLAAGGGDLRTHVSYRGGGGETKIHGGFDKVVRVWDTSTWKLRATLPQQAQPSARCERSLDGRVLVTSGPDLASVRVWDTGTWTAQRWPGDASAEIEAFALAPDGRSVATGGEDGILRLWDIETGTLLAAHAGHPYGVVQVVFGPDGTWMAASGGDKVTRIWDLAHTPGRGNVSPRDWHMEHLAVAHDGGWLAATEHSSATIDLYDVASGQAIGTLDRHESPVAGVAIPATGDWMITTTRHGQVNLWAGDRDSLKLVRSETRAWSPAVAIAPDNTWVAVGHQGSIEIWRADDWETLHSFAAHAEVMRLAVSPDGRWLASSGGGDHTVKLWDTTTWHHRHTFTGWDGSALSMGFGPDGSWMATTGYDKSGIRIFDTGSGELRALLADHESAVECLAVAPGGRWLATVGWDHALRVWDTTTWKPAALMRFEATLYACAWLPAGDGIVVGGKSGVFLFDFIKD
jgi:WD40 repeat protein